MKRFVMSGLVATCSIAAMTVVLAADEAGQTPTTPEQKAQQAVEVRQGLQKLMNFQMAPMGDMLKRKIPFDAATVTKRTQNILALGSMQADAFAEDTHNVKGLKTKARDGIWTNKSDFDAKSQNLQNLANELLTAAKSGDEAATKKAIATMGSKGCGGCHDQFKDKG